MKRAWYLRLDEHQVGEAAILVGDRSRVRLIEGFLTGAEVLNEDRGLLTVVGDYEGTKVVVVAFGMGAPIAAVVAHELIDLGITRLVRLGTMIRLGGTGLGDIVVATSAQTNDGTSISYGPGKREYHADAALSARAVTAAQERGAHVIAGRAMSVDGFYTEMMQLDAADTFQVAQRHAAYERAGCVGLDMETAALFAVGERFEVAATSVCVATVDGLTRAKLDDVARTEAERRLSLIGLETIRRHHT